MVDPILRQAVRGRKIGGWAMARAGKTPGYKHTSINTVHGSHVSSRVMQDKIDEAMRRQIANTPAGPRRDFLMRDYHLWVQNGRPTQDIRDKCMEPIKTWQKGKPLSNDLLKMGIAERNEKIKRELGLT